MTKYKPHWHDQNPYKNELIYVPLEELAECFRYYGKPLMTADGMTAIGTSKLILDKWNALGSHLDGFILTGKLLMAGVRYGPEPEDYFYPEILTHKLIKLFQKHRFRG